MNSVLRNDAEFALHRGTSWPAGASDRIFGGHRDRDCLRENAHDEGDENEGLFADCGGSGGVNGAGAVLGAEGGSGGAAVEAAKAGEAAANPLYSVWKGQEGKTVTFNRSEEISGGAPIIGGGGTPAASSRVQFALSEFTAERAVIKVTNPGMANGAAETLTIPAKLMPDDPAFPKEAGSEDLKFGDKTYACKKYEYSTNSEAEMGRSGQGLAARDGLGGRGRSWRHRAAAYFADDSCILRHYRYADAGEVVCRSFFW